MTAAHTGFSGYGHLARRVDLVILVFRVPWNWFSGYEIITRITRKPVRSGYSGYSGFRSNNQKTPNNPKTQKTEIR